MGDLNLADWVERRRQNVGANADYIVKSIRDYEVEIERLRRIETAARSVLDDMQVGNWSQYKEDALAEALVNKEDQANG